ncbi:hypothetical protein [Lyngbya sp. CCY1209]|jgi:hypothetical protein|uniref:hypothetical protein n=1 Tax=Lyngbya sp. CCY1209 TaxID=2886103 RepID=UPI002D217E2D|nr:hypothetical protein [Lyngbya sp. CCY1209]MEB3884328.1 hypothetical protein [Lyngbya sp. CCY1209]
MSGKTINWRDYGDVLIAYYEDVDNGIYLKFRSDAPYNELRWRDRPFPLTYPHGCPAQGRSSLDAIAEQVILRQISTRLQAS